MSRLVLTPEERNTILFVAALFLVGLAARLYRQM